MKKTILRAILCSLITITSFAQDKNSEKGKYIAAKRNEKFKFNLLEGNKFELVVIYGDYEKKGDTLYFSNQVKNKSNFTLVSNPNTTSQDNVVRIKIKKDQILYHFSGIYIGTQEGKLPVQYKKLQELAGDIDSSEANEFVIEIPRSKYIYLIYENYSGKSEHTKYALPKNTSDIDLNFSSNIFSEVSLKGYIDKETKDLVVSDLGGREPISFRLENTLEENSQNEIQPLEVKSEKNWTYNGKDLYNDSEAAAAVDSAAVAVEVAADDVAYATAASSYEQLKIHTSKSLSKSLKDISKQKNQFLVIVYDPKNKNLQEEFDYFITNQQSDSYYYSSTGADGKKHYPYNYVIASDKDKKWLDKNKIKDNPAIVIADYKGNVLTRIKGSLQDKSYLFATYGNLASDLDRHVVFKETNSILNSVSSKTDVLLKAFKQIATLDYQYPEKTRDVSIDAEEVNTPVEYAAPLYSSDYELPTVKWDETNVNANWAKVIDASHKNNSSNDDLVNLIAREISNKGFTNQIFKKEKALNKVDYLSIDYILKHYNSLREKTFTTSNPSVDLVEVPVKIGKILSDALNTNIYYSETLSQKQDDLNILEKLLKADEYKNSDVAQSFFSQLNNLAESNDLENEYVANFDAFFDANFGKNKNCIESLDELFVYNQGSEWGFFKTTISDMINNAAWFVVKKSTNTDNIKKAINWSEGSLIMQKNNAYYLDTLAQLYYKNGEKTKAIKTQELAVKYLDTVDDNITRDEIKDILKKMKSGKL